MKNEQIVLSIETAVRGGSISLLKGEREIDFWLGTNKVSKAEDILEQISVLLAKNKVEKHQIDLITVSHGPGSMTGIRIGIALAKGLKKSLDCLMKSVSVLDALHLKAKFESSENTIISAVPVNSSHIGWQIYKSVGLVKNSTEPPNCSTKEIFISELKAQRKFVLVIQQHLYEQLIDLLKNGKQSTIQTLPEINLARWIGLLGKKEREESVK